MIERLVSAYCSQYVGTHYAWQHADMTQVFQQIYETLQATKREFRMLIYNGDVDTACPFLEAQWFFDQFATNYNMVPIPTVAVLDSRAGHMSTHSFQQYFLLYYYGPKSGSVSRISTVLTGWSSALVVFRDFYSPSKPPVLAGW